MGMSVSAVHTRTDISERLARDDLDQIIQASWTFCYSCTKLTID